MDKSGNATEATLSGTIDALTTKVLAETLDFLEQESSGFKQNCTIALSGKASYALSRPSLFDKFKLMFTDRLVLIHRYPKQEKRALRRFARERPRLRIIPGTVSYLAFKIGGTPEEIAQEIKPAPPKKRPTPMERGTSGDVPF